MEESKCEGIDLGNDDEVRVKTIGVGSFIESITKLDAVSKVTCNMAGDEQVGASWTDKVFSVKASQDAGGSSGGDRGKDNVGATDEEWGD